MTESWKQNLRTIDPYTPGEQPHGSIIKLNANENPYPPAPGVTTALEAFSVEGLRLYPDANSNKLKQALAAYHGLPQNQVFVANGSDEALGLAYLACFCTEKPILFPDITYSFYPVWCDLFQVPYETIPLTADFRIQAKDYARPNGGILIPNPNAPTGIGQGQAFFREILENNPHSVVMVDEAYVDFGAESCVPLLAEYDNLLILQTFSKSRSLAGLRIGVALGSPALIQTLEAVKNSYNSYTCDSLAIELGTASVTDTAYFQETTQKIIHTRDETASELAALGFLVSPSQANFLFVTHPEVEAEDLFLHLKEKGIYIRYFKLPKIDRHLRITIGTDDDMKLMLAEIKAYLKA